MIYSFDLDFGILPEKKSRTARTAPPPLKSANLPSMYMDGIPGNGGAGGRAGGHRGNCTGPHWPIARHSTELHPLLLRDSQSKPSAASRKVRTPPEGIRTASFYGLRLEHARLPQLPVPPHSAASRQPGPLVRGRSHARPHPHFTTRPLSRQQAMRLPRSSSVFHTVDVPLTSARDMDTTALDEGRIPPSPCQHVVDVRQPAPLNPSLPATVLRSPPGLDNGPRLQGELRPPVP